MSNSLLIIFFFLKKARIRFKNLGIIDRHKHLIFNGERFEVLDVD